MSSSVRARSSAGRSRSKKRTPISVTLVGLIVVTGAAITALIAFAQDRDETEGTGATPDIVRSYRISDEEVAIAQGASGEVWEISFDASWVKSDRPDRAGCTYQVYDSGGNVLVSKTFTLFVAAGSEEGLTTRVEHAPSGAPPKSVDISC